MPSIELHNRVFDARPDRIGYSDRFYNLQLVSLPKEYPDPHAISIYLKNYTQHHKLILDQGTEGACTGFGLVVRKLRKRGLSHLFLPEKAHYYRC